MMKSLLLLAGFAIIFITAAAGWAAPPQMKGAHREVYREVDGTKLAVWIFEPETKAPAPRPAVVFFFGGGWVSGTPAQFEAQCRHFAARGMVAMTADYRVKKRNQAKAADCVEDAKACIAWVRKNAGRLGIDPEKIAAGGGSAGGHIAACTGTVPGFGSDERPNAMILFNPGLALAPWKGKDFGGFGTHLGKAKLGAEPEAISPIHHIDAKTPPTIIFHGMADTTVPYASAEAFAAAMHDAGRPCRLVGYEGQKHGFFNREPFRAKNLKEADHFLEKLGWLKKSAETGETDG